MSKKSLLKLLASDVKKFHIVSVKNTAAAALVRRGLAEEMKISGWIRITIRGQKFLVRLADDVRVRNDKLKGITN